MSATNLRKRNPLKSAKLSIDDETDDHVLDEQEQEQVIHELNLENIRISRLYYWLATIIVAVSFFTQLGYFVNILRGLKRPVIGPVMGCSFALLDIAAHIHFILILNHVRYIKVEGEDTMVPKLLPFQLLTALPFFATLTSGAEKEEILWWVGPILATFVSGSCVKWMAEGDEAVRELERLKYEAKGA